MPSPKTPDSIIRHLFRLCRRWGILFLAWYIFGSLIFQAKGADEAPRFWGYSWVHSYHTWQIIKDYLAIRAVVQMFSIYFPDYKKSLNPIIFYATVRVCFQIPVLFLKMNPNAEEITNTLWILALIATLTLTINRINRKWKALN